MPLLFAMLLVLLGYALTTPAFMQGFEFCFTQIFLSCAPPV